MTVEERRASLRSGGREVAQPEVARSHWRRGIGLMGRRRLDPPDGLLISPCSSVHTCFMRFPIDVLYLDRDYGVLKVVHEMKPWRFSFGARGAKHVLELPAGQASAYGLAPGDQLELTT